MQAVSQTIKVSMADCWHAVVGAVLAPGLRQVLSDQLQHSAWVVVDSWQLVGAEGQALAVAQGAAKRAQVIGHTSSNIYKGHVQVAVSTANAL
jgi:hypothetical protein